MLFVRAPIAEANGNLSNQILFNITFSLLPQNLVVSNLESAETENVTSPPSAANKPDKSDRRSAAWDVQNAVRNYATLIAAQGASAFFSFASVWLATRYLGAEGYGSVVTLIAASFILQLFVNWAATAVARFGVEEFVETGKITKTFWTRLIILFPNLLIILVVSFFLLPLFTTALKVPSSATPLLVTYFLVNSIWLNIQQALIGAKMPAYQALLLGVERAIIFAALLILIFTNQISWINFAWCYILSSVLVSLVGIWHLRKLIEFNSFYDAGFFRKFLYYSLPLVPYSLIGYLSTSQLDAIFINQFLSIKELGVYSIATQITGILLQVPTLANTLLLSLFVSLQTVKKEETIHRFFKDLVPTLTFVWGGVCIFSAFVLGEIIPLIFGEEFREAKYSLWILLTASAVSAPVLFGYAALTNSISATYISTIAGVLAALTNFALNFLLIPRFGMIGCALATFFSYLVTTIAVVILCKRKIYMPTSWAFISMLPSIITTICFIAFQNLFTALFLCVVSNLFIFFLFKSSVKEGLAILLNRLK